MKFLIALFCAFALVAAETPTLGSPAFVNDNNALNYALTLKQLEANFYNTALANLTQQDFANAGFNQTIFNWLQLIREHENLYVNAITAALNGRNTAAVRPCTYNFTSFNVSTFLQTAMTIESIAVSAFVGAIDTVTDTTLLNYAVAGASVEARHSAFLNELNGRSPFPNATEPSLTPTQVASLIGGYLTTCPDNLTLPLPADTYRSNETVNSANNNQTRSPAYLNDNNALNYALYLENLEAAFYNQFLCNATISNFTNAGVNSTSYEWIQMIRMHEDAHVAALRMVLSSRGATPVAPCTYNFNVTSVAEFLATARTLENVGVSAYIGAANTFSSQALLTYAASILTVEARHAAFLNEITGQNPFPNATDAALAPSAVLSLASRYVVNCSANITLPVPADTFRPNGSASTGTGATGAATTGAASTANTGVIVTGATGGSTGQATGATGASTGTVATGTAATTGRAATGATGASTGTAATTGRQTTAATGASTGTVATGTAATTGSQATGATGATTGVIATGTAATTGSSVTAGATGASTTGNQATGIIATGTAATTGSSVTAGATGAASTTANNGVTGAAATTGTAATGNGATGAASTTGSNTGSASTANAGTTGLINTGATTAAPVSNTGQPSNTGSTTGIPSAFNPEMSSAVTVVASAALSCLVLLFI